MFGGSLLGLGLPLLLFLLAPGYIGLRGYLKASVQLDTISRTDKLILGLIGGITSLGVMLVLNRFGILSATVEFWYSLWTGKPWTSKVGFRLEHAVTPESAGSFTALSLMGFLCGQSIVAYIGGYLWGIHNHVASDEMPKAKEDLEQPWERAVKDSVITGEITVVTKQGEEIRGDLYRIGSPSENYDVLLSGAEKIVQGGDNERLGVTYHHHRDISRVEFDVPGIDPRKSFNDEYNSKLAQKYSLIYTAGSEFRGNPRKKIQEWSQKFKDRAEVRIGDLQVWIAQRRAPELSDPDQIVEKITEASRRASRLRDELSGEDK